MMTLYAQATNTFITSQTYQNDQAMLFYVTAADTAVYKLQEKTEHGLIKTTSVSHFNMEVEALFGRLSPQKPWW